MLSLGASLAHAIRDAVFLSLSLLQAPSLAGDLAVLALLPLPKQATLFSPPESEACVVLSLTAQWQFSGLFKIWSLL